MFITDTALLNPDKQSDLFVNSHSSLFANSLVSFGSASYNDSVIGLGSFGSATAVVDESGIGLVIIPSAYRQGLIQELSSSKKLHKGVWLLPETLVPDITLLNLRFGFCLFVLFSRTYKRMFFLSTLKT